MDKRGPDDEEERGREETAGGPVKKGGKKCNRLMYNEAKSGTTSRRSKTTGTPRMEDIYESNKGLQKGDLSERRGSKREGAND